jgi:hypothetical protein
VLYSPAIQRAHYKNLYVCGRIWQCPVCAAKVSERRRIEITGALANIPYQAILVTYTLRHTAEDKLTVLLVALKRARANFNSGRPWQALARRHGWVSQIRSLECTHGDHGWHPHLHELALLAKDNPHDLGALESDLRQRWLTMLEKAGFDASWEHGVVVTSNDKLVKEYIAKWGHAPDVDRLWTIERELTKSISKKAHKEGRTTFRLLGDFGQGDTPAGKRYVEFIEAFKGEHQLNWGRGLRQRLGIQAEEKTDRELATESTEDSDVLATLTHEEWKIVLANDARAELLTVANHGDPVLLRSWLDELTGG